MWKKLTLQLQSNAFAENVSFSCNYINEAQKNSRNGTYACINAHSKLPPVYSNHTVQATVELV